MKGWLSVIDWVEIAAVLSICVLCESHKVTCQAVHASCAYGAISNSSNSSIGKCAATAAAREPVAQQDSNTKAHENDWTNGEMREESWRESPVVSGLRKCQIAERDCARRPERSQKQDKNSREQLALQGNKNSKAGLTGNRFTWVPNESEQDQIGTQVPSRQADRTKAEGQNARQQAGLTKLSGLKCECATKGAGRTNANTRLKTKSRNG